MKYQCVDNFEVEKYDDDVFDDFERISIMTGTIWERDMSYDRIMGGDIKLDNPETGDCLEIPFGAFLECFCRVD